MYKNEKGISMVMLVIIVIVMLILSGIIIYEGTSAIKSAKKQSIYTNLLLIQAKARVIKEKVDFGERKGYLGTEDNELKSKFNSEAEGIKIYKLSQDDLNEMEVEVSGDNHYAVDYDNDEVYYIKGIEDKEGNLHYALTDIASLGIVTEE